MSLRRRKGNCLTLLKWAAFDGDNVVYEGLVAYSGSIEHGVLQLEQKCEGFE